MKKTTKLLADEHKKILKVADALEKEYVALESKKEINEKFFVGVIDFIRNYADKFHHAKEEDILFKELCKDSVQEKMHCNPVEMMLYEHDMGRNFVRGMEEAISKKDKKKIIENARGYVGLIREHIFKEDNILYPMADEVLSDKIQQSILEKFKKISTSKKKEIEGFEKFVKEVSKR